MNIYELVRQKGLRLNISPRTIKTYQHCLKVFFKTVRIDPLKLKKRDIENYIYHLIDQKRSSSTINVHLSSLKFFYQKVLNRRLTIYIPLQKNVKRLPEFLTVAELKKVFAAIDNPKHLLMIKLLYSAGLRVSELCNLRVKDLQLEQSYLWVRQGKGRKDRSTVISKYLINQLMSLIQNEQLSNSDYLFSPYSKRRSYHPRSIHAIVKKASIIAKVRKNIHPHTFRHSFATHLVEQGNSIQEVQPLLGHTSIRTTMKYLHMARPNINNVISPLDQLEMY